MFCSFISWEEIKEIRRWKINLRLRELIPVKKKIRIVYFVHEVIKNEVSCKWFYEIVEGVEDFCVINLPKS